MDYKFSFEKLEVWQVARALASEIYKLTESYPKSELYGLTSQSRRAVISVSSNIAEGTSRQSFTEQARFTEIAYGSLSELLSQLFIAYDLEYISEETLSYFKMKVGNISKKISSLRNSQIQRTSINPKNT